MIIQLIQGSKGVMLAGLFFTIAMLTGCETVLELELPEGDPMICINGLAKADEPLTVHLSLSENVSSSASDFQTLGSRAVVTLYKAGVLHEELQLTGNGLFVSSQSISRNADYKITVTYPGHDPASCSFALPEPVPIDSVRVKDISNSGHLLSLSFVDPAKQKNYYILTCSTIYEGENMSHYKNIEPRGIFEDRGVLLFDYDKLDGYAFSDGALDGENINLLFTTWLDDKTNFRCELHSISEEFYLYLKSYSAFDSNDGNPFAQKITVHSNVTGGVGLLGAYSTSRYDVVE